MFNRSRRKIILSIMGSLILLFAAALSVILFASYREIGQNNSEMLERYAELYLLEQQTGEDQAAEPAQQRDDRPPEGGPGDMQGQPPPDRGPDGMGDKPPSDRGMDFQLSTFYSVALSEDGTVLAVDNGDNDLYSEEDLIRIAKEILADHKTSGRTDHLTYIADSRPNYTLVAFMDNTVTDSSMATLLRNFLIVGGAAIIVLFFLSLLISGRIIRPLEENDRQQKQFVSDASHELKTPVAVIAANAELLSREIGDNEWLGNIQYENERMGELIRQLLDLSRAENAEIEMEAVDFSRIVTGEVLAFETLAYDSGRVIHSDIEDGITLTGNRTQLTQLTSILLDNAVRHAAGEEIRITLKHQGHHAVLCVANDGEEIPQWKQEHLFDRFYRVDEARNSDEGKHYGLGLSIAKAVTERHGGSIGVSFRDGKVYFTASLPEKKQINK